MNTMIVKLNHVGAPRSQRGAALFVSMMILILLSMLALSASQVTSLQQKMATAYWADMRAFENAEALLRETEKLVRNGDPDNPDRCAVPIDSTDVAGGWVASAPSSPEGIYTHFKLPGSSIRSGQSHEVGDVTCPFFRVSSVNFDDPADPSSTSVVQSVFVP